MTKERHFKDPRDDSKKCAEHLCGVVWYDSGQKEARFWRVCEKYHHAFNGEFEYSEIPEPTNLTS